MMEKLLLSIKTVFSDFDEKRFREDLLLGEIEQWDSMNSVNLSIELEASFGVSLSGAVLTADDRVSDVVALLKDRGAK